MPSERVQRQIDRLLDEAEQAIGAEDWLTVAARARSALALDESNADAAHYLSAAERSLAGGSAGAVQPEHPLPSTPSPSEQAQPTSFANGRYVVKRFLGEGGKKKVYLAHDSLLDRDVAFALIKTEGLDEASRTRITREAQAMGRLGDHPNIVTVYDIGEEHGAPYMVLPVLAGGDVEGVIEKAPEQRMPLERALKIAIETCRGLEFAHGKGIVHRDLKPGNVWLSEDGTAKIGDFGLAVATDRSRLTQAGMMVGTVSYMPPEQAMGGEVGPRSDLYSLGAMLYEMVCGRPPFVGDESVAIIGQHLNTPPIAPTWHRPDCPPALETLILRLLGKDPSQRPASATEVRQALESVNVRTFAPRDPSVAVESPSAENPLYRRTFVGRENEVRQLQAAFDAALSGQGGLVMVVGEPGIGKTAICEQLATYVALRGGKALVGHCYEEGSLSLPYLAFVEAMRSYVLAREPDGLRSDLGTGAADVARIVSEVRDRVQGVETRSPADPEDDRWRLLQASTSFLRNASAVQPLCIVLEDLHWADRGTLDLLLHMSRNLQGARLLIVGTYRDVEVDRAHPLSGTLAELRRQTNFVRVPLRGLTVDEVHRMYEAIRGQATPWAQAEAVHRQTEGNPLFVQEVLRYLVEEGLVVREGGRYVPQIDAGSGIPEGLRDVVGKRLSRLSERSNQVLSLAAVEGRDFRLDVLQKVTGLSDEDLFQALEEAQERAIIEQRGVTGSVGFRFTHAFFRQTLYEEIFTPRRIRFHQQIGRALEDIHSRRLDDHATELAEHFSQSVDVPDLTKAVFYGQLAAKRAIAVLDYGEAVRHLDQALKAQEILDPDDDARRFDFLLELEETLPLAGNPDRVLEVVAPEALALALKLGDLDRASQACVRAIRVYLWGFGDSGTLARRMEWLRLADQYVPDGTVDRVRVEFQMGTTVRQGDPAKAWEHFKKSFRLAEELDDNEGLIISSNAMLSTSETPIDEYPMLADIVERLAVRQLGTGRSRDLCGFWSSEVSAFLSLGRRSDAEATRRKLVNLVTITKDPQVEEYELAMRAHFATLDGELESALEIGDEMLERATRAGVSGRGPRGRAVRRALIYLGRYQDALDSLGEPAGILTMAGGAIAAQRAYCLAYTGRVEEARLILGAFLEYLNEREAHLSAIVFRYLLEAAVVAREESACEEFVGRMQPLAPFAVSEAGMTFCVARHLADAEALLGRPLESRKHYELATRVCLEMRFRPELALSRLGLAELLLDHYPDERDAAIEHLDFAIGEFQAMKMQPALERALGHRGLLKA